MTTAVSLVVLPAFLLSAYGWGRLVRVWCDVPLLRLRSMTAIVGLAVMNVLGGAVNLFRMANPGVLASLLLLGCLITVFDLLWSLLRRRRGYPVSETSHWEKSPRASFTHALPYCAALGLGLAAATLLGRGSVFNIHDDFHVYLPRPLRMLQTGTLAGNPFDMIGVDSLGSQAFFQGFFLIFGVRSANGFDAVTCFFLALSLSAELATVQRLPIAVAVLGIFAVAVINPQYVNISPLYSGVVVIMALITMGTSLPDQFVGSAVSTRGRVEFILALLIGLLMTLKVTHAFFGVFYLVCLYAFCLAGTGNRSAVLKSFLFTSLGTAALIAPWLLLHASTIHRAGQLASPLAGDALLAAKYQSVAAHNIPQLLSPGRLVYGDRGLSYHFLAAICLGSGIVALAKWRRHRQHLGLFSIAAGAVASIAVYLLNAHLFYAQDAVRYSCPALIGCSVLGLGGLLWSNDSRKRRFYRWPTAAVVCLLLCVIAVFGKTFYDRAHLARRAHTLLSFPISPEYMEYSQKEISPGEQEYIRGIQRKMKPTATALVWISMPMNLDFRRNRLLTVSESGLSTPATRFPAGIAPDTLRRYLEGWGVRYVWVQVSGPGIKDIAYMKSQLDATEVLYRQLADYGIYLREALGVLATQSATLYSDNEMLVFDIQTPVRAGDSPAVRP